MPRFSADSSTNSRRFLTKCLISAQNPRRFQACYKADRQQIKEKHAGIKKQRLEKYDEIRKKHKLGTYAESEKNWGMEIYIFSQAFFGNSFRVFNEIAMMKAQANLISMMDSREPVF